MVTPEFLWGLDNVGISYRMYAEAPFERFAGIHVHHGATTTATGLAVRSGLSPADARHLLAVEAP